MRIVLIELTAVRPDHLACQEYPRPTSPAIDQLAATACIFTNCHAAWLPGASLMALAAALAPHGYATATLPPDRALGWIQGTAKGLVHIPIAPPAAPDPSLLARVRTEDGYTVGGMPPDEAIRPRLDAYDAAIAAQDALLSPLVSGLPPDALVILTATSGMAIGEMSCTFVPVSTADGSSHVPLILRVPGLTDAGWLYDGLLYQHDAVPTVLAAMGLPAPPPAPGQPDALSHLPALRGEPMQGRHHVVTRFPDGQAVRTDTHRLVRTNAVTALYDLNADPLQQVNIAPQNPTMVRDLLALSRP